MRFVLLATVLLAACGQSREDELQSENADLRAEVSQLQSDLNTAKEQLEEIREKAQTLASANDNMQSDVQRFSYDNWRDVVPDAASSAEQVEQAEQELQSASEEQ